jgi:hypothetical protein
LTNTNTRLIKRSNCDQKLFVAMDDPLSFIWWWHFNRGVICASWCTLYIIHPFVIVFFLSCAGMHNTGICTKYNTFLSVLIKSLIIILVLINFILSFNKYILMLFNQNKNVCLILLYDTFYMTYLVCKYL